MIHDWSRKMALPRASWERLIEAKLARTNVCIILVGSAGSGNVTGQEFLDAAAMIETVVDGCSTYGTPQPRDVEAARTPTSSVTASSPPSTEQAARVH